MGSIDEVLAAIRQAPTNFDRGVFFEHLMVRYFQLDPMYAQRFDQVCRWADWDGATNKQDHGIDLVARERDTGEYTAIQCKFYEPTTTLSKGDIDSFFTASGKKPFTKRMIISTTDSWGKNAESAIPDQHIDVQRIGMEILAESPIDWDIAWPAGQLSIEPSLTARKQPRPHQTEAIDDVLARFAAGNDRGKLIMACGTGKTFTALKIAERIAEQNAGSARVLFLVPSISLLSQSLREWTAQCELDLRAFAVCSDTKVGKLRTTIEDFNVHDVPIPVTTNPATLRAEMERRKHAKGLTVVFATYQSLPAVADAQALGVDAFDLAVCDEAHRTTGVTLAGEEDSHFVRIHNGDYIRAARRLYMTATPRVFADTVKDKAELHSAELVSMDDELRYGPEFHHLSFGNAVDRRLLTDYKVLVLTVDESVIAAPMQRQLATFGEIPNLDDASRIVGCWNGLAKRGADFAPGQPPMQRAVAFARDIKTSKALAELFPRVVTAYQHSLTERAEAGEQITDTNRDLHCEVRHVDGTFNALQRNKELAWLKSPVEDNECRILTNARCLSEGVDVPDLDAVLFLHPRGSVVDVVQSVGRVMRLSEGKDYGYVILPVAVPAGLDPAAALADNQRFKVVWQVLNALRSHDERFDAMINSISLNTATPESRLLVDHLGPTDTDTGDGQDSPTSRGTQEVLFALGQWQEAIYTRIVDRVGTRVYWDQWAADVADIASAQITRINTILASSDTGPAIGEQFERFWKGLRDNLNDSISRDDAISMLSQHLITKPIFEALFAGHDFATHNPVSKVMQAMTDALDGHGLAAETKRLDKFYNSVQLRAEQVVSAEGKQHLIAELYEKFFRTAFKKQSDALGIVYTPTEVVDFILRAADHATREHFGRGLTDEGVHILDGFTGTGTFITRLLQAGLISPADLERKYAHELHANEITLLAYYIAAVNIETTYHALTGKTADSDDYQPFPGIVLADTFQISEHDDSLDLEVFAANNDRITRQLETKTLVVLGNPPYSVGQSSANDQNANVAYPTLDDRIRGTYLKDRNRGGSNSLFDSYIRAFRWATDRIGDAGVVAFVSNGGWIDGNTADGMRLSLADEYSHIYVYNLRGNMRNSDWRKEGGQIFGAGSQATIAVFVGIKDPKHVGVCHIDYASVSDGLTRDQKLTAVAENSIPTLDWQRVFPNSEGDWINQRDNEFVQWPVIGDKQDSGQVTVFSSYSRGLETGRDAWVYNFSQEALISNCRSTIAFFTEAEKSFQTWLQDNQRSRDKAARDDFFTEKSPYLNDPRRISWTLSLKNRFLAGTEIEFDGASIRTAVYRPFCKRSAYFNRHLNHILGRLTSMFPTVHHTNVGIAVTGPASHFEFTPFIAGMLPDLHLLDTAQFFPRWTYQPADQAGGFDFSDGAEVDEYGYRRIDNITDEILALYRRAIGGQVNKDDIFYYVYGVLHDPEYRFRYAADLKKMLPRIPTPTSAERFAHVAGIGRQLADLHINYEEAQPYPLDIHVRPGASPESSETWWVAKMKWKSKTDRSAIVYNSAVTIAGIPEAAHEYVLGSRSALQWIIDRYQVKTDKASGIVNDPNDWCDEHDDPTYIVELIKKVTTVSVETVRLVAQLGGGPGADGG